MNLARRYEGCLTSQKWPPRIALTHVDLALKDKKRIVGNVVHMLWKFVPRFRDSIVEREFLSSHLSPAPGRWPDDS